MNQNITPVYAGLDIAKASLQLHLQSKSCDLTNSPAGHDQLVNRLSAIPAGIIYLFHVYTKGDLTDLDQ